MKELAQVAGRKRESDFKLVRVRCHRDFLQLRYFLQAYDSSRMVIRFKLRVSEEVNGYRDGLLWGSRISISGCVEYLRAS